MNRTLAAEFRKMRYQRSTYGTIAAASALAAISPISLIATAQLPRRALFMDLTTVDTMRTVMASSASGYLFALVMGIVMSTSEFRHSTAVATYLAQPVRSVVMLMKMLTAAVMGFIVQLVSTSVGFLAGNLYVARYAHASLTTEEYLRILAGSLLVGVVLAVVGVAVGSLIRAQMVAVLVAVLWLQLIEGLLIVFADWLGKWSIRGAITSVLEIAMRSPEVSVNASDMLAPWQSVLLLLAYAAAFATVATITSMRRDID